jgi:hypothetical protein
MNLRRLPRMSVVEVAGRTRQEASKWWDRMATGDARRRLGGDGTGDGRRLFCFRETVASRFFAGAVEDDTPSLLEDRVPGFAREVIAKAERILDGRFDLLGYRGLSFGDPLDWRRDPVSGRRSPLVHWSRLDPLDTAAGGDSKVVWELNRHQWLVDLAQAYRMTGDARHARAAAAYVTSWLDANSTGMGINWASSLEVALRLVAWSWMLVLLRRSPDLRPELFARMCASLEDHAAHVEKYLSYYFAPNTHLTGEALGLFYAGTVFPELRGAGRWRELGARILVKELRRQVRPDGVYFEQSTCYQRYSVEIALHFLVLCARRGVSVPAAVGERVQAMLDFLLATRLPQGEAPPIGDADGGWLLPLARRAPGDLRGVFGIAAALFGRSDYAQAAEGIVPELLWLLGSQGLGAFEAMRPSPPSTSASRLFADGGYAVMRDGWGRKGHQLIFDVGPLGCPASAGHGHADLLSVQCAAYGQAFVVDPGTGTYADPAWRRFFRSSGAHSTVTIDGESQAVPAGPFAWRQRPRARLNRWRSTAALDFADAEHDAYGRLADPVRHRRRVLFVKPRYWVLVDDLEGVEPHLVELRFQFGPVDVTPGPPPWVRATAAGRALLVRPFADAPLEARVSEGGLEPLEGWVSPDYGRRQPAPMVVYATTTPLPLRIVTLLLPSAEPEAPPPAVAPLRGKDRQLAGLVFEATGETVSIDETS